MKQDMISMMSQYCPIETMYPRLRNNLRSRSDKNISTLYNESTREYRKDLYFVSNNFDKVTDRLDSSLPYCITNIFKPRSFCYIYASFAIRDYVYDDIVVDGYKLNFNKIFDTAKNYVTAIVERMKV